MEEESGKLFCRLSLILGLCWSCYFSILQAKVPHPAYDNLNEFDATQPVWYQTLVENSQFKKAELPWTDTYWPFFKLGHADRWLSTDIQTYSTPSLYKFLLQYFSSIRTGDFKSRLFFSPAEKYDYLLMGQQSRALETMAESSANHSRLASLEDISQLTHADFAGTEASPWPLEARSFLSKTEQLENGLSSGALRPGQYAKEIRTLIDESGWFRFHFPLVADAWRNWSSYKGDPQFSRNDSAWSWMGHCHGWSVAAIKEQPSDKGVLVKHNHSSILFTPGDIRGLLTKAWANQPPKETQLGRKCETEPKWIDRGNGALSYRTYDGRVHSGSRQGEGFLLLEKFAAFNQDGTSLLGYKVHFEGDLEQTHYALYGNGGIPGTATFPPGFYEYSNPAAHTTGLNFTPILVVFESFEELELFAWSHKSPPVLEHQEKILEIELSEGCRDSNPMAWVKLLENSFRMGDKKLVVDRDFYSETWNQPIYGYQFKYSELQDIHFWNPQITGLLAPGTAFTSKVEGHLLYSAEPHQHLPVFTPNYDKKAITKLPVSFTLEFDLDQKLIGGHWNAIPPSIENYTNKRRFRPDYLAQFKKSQVESVAFLKKDYHAAAGNKNEILFDTRWLYKLVDCSRNENLPVFRTEISYRDGGIKTAKLDYVECSLED